MTDTTNKDLKAQADKLGVKYSPNIGTETLQARVSKAIAKIATETNEVAAQKAKAKVKPETQGQRNARKKKEASKLVRVIISNKDPRDNNRTGITFQVSNSVIGTLGKHVPFGVVWHVPQAVLNVFAEKTHQIWINGKSKYGITKRIPKTVSTYSIEYLDPLTPKEFEDLKIKQAMADNIED